jgi:hypothetical protein
MTNKHLPWNSVVPGGGAGDVYGPLDLKQRDGSWTAVWCELDATEGPGCVRWHDRTATRTVELGFGVSAGPAGSGSGGRGVGLAAAATTTKTLAFTPTTPAQSLRVSDLKSLRRLLKALGTDAAAAAGAALARTRPLPLGSVRLGPPSHLRCRSDQDDEGAADAHASGHLNSSSSSSNQGGSTAPQGARRLAEPSRPPPPRWQLSVSHGSQTVREITVAGRRRYAFVMFAGGVKGMFLFKTQALFFFKRYTLEPKERSVFCL